MKTGGKLMLKSFIHTGDFHLGRPFTFSQQGNYYGKSKRKELWKAFDHMIAYAKEKEIELLLIAGDLFDSINVLTMDVKRVAESFKSLDKAWVIVVAGNHDYNGEDSPYKKVEWPRNVYIFNEDRFRSVYIQELNTEIYGFSWVKNEYREFPELSFDRLHLNEGRYNILLMHGEVATKSPYLPINLKKIEDKGFHAICLGHIHKPGITSGGVAYCGSPVPLDFGETGDHGFLSARVEVDYEKQLFLTKNRFNPIHSRCYETLELAVTPEDSYADILDKATTCDSRDNRMNNYYRLKLTGLIDPEIHLDWINDDLEDAFYYIETDLSGLESDIDIDKLMAENKDNPVGAFLQELKEIQDEDIKKRALLYSIEAMLKEGVLK
jgi:DNA repair exonuclease SbcCD nuclease subunit